MNGVVYQEFNENGKPCLIFTFNGRTRRVFAGDFVEIIFHDVGLILEGKIRHNNEKDFVCMD